MTLDRITFTGVDDHTDLAELVDLAREYPRFIGEFGVLIGTSTLGEPHRSDMGIFPSFQRVKDLRDLGRILGIKTALHICGDPARRLMGNRGPSDFLVEEICILSQGFTRIQINLHGDQWNSKPIDVTAKAVDAIVPYLGGETVILQHRSGWDDLPPVSSPRVEYLFDLSEGGGIDGFDQWPPPPTATPAQRVGYAGGIGSDNIERAAQFAEEAPVPVWLDMEGRIRTDGLLDIAKVSAVYNKAITARNRARVVRARREGRNV